jgi:hypothetical protein
LVATPALAVETDCDFGGCPPAWTAPVETPRAYSPEPGVVYPLGPPKPQATPLPSVAVAARRDARRCLPIALTFVLCEFRRKPATDSDLMLAGVPK